ncbi:MAG: imidazolonepropionase-like amidohydrolase [Pseudohongiellaceae bacterium]|jgi:imidazolonepropionase-like amidohydrolase
MLQFCCRLVLTCLFVAQPLLASPGPVGEDWDIEEVRGPTLAFEETFDEGTWISVDTSPDGQHLVFDLLGQLYELPMAGGEAVPLTEGRSWNMFPRYSPDGGSIAFTSDRSGQNNLWTYDRSSGELVNVSQEQLPTFQGTWSSDGRALYGTALNNKVRFPASRYGLLGSKQVVIPPNGRQPVNHLQENPVDGLLYFVHKDRSLPSSGPRVKTWDMESGEISVLVDRPGGAAAARLSPDGLSLAYVHRDDQDTVLVVRDLHSGMDRELRRDLDRGRFDSSSFYGCHPNMAWHPDGGSLVLSIGGKLVRVDLQSGASSEIPFRASVARVLDETIRFPLELPSSGMTTARSYRWAQRTAAGIVFETLGDLWRLGNDGSAVNLTQSPAHETSPVFLPDTTGQGRGAVFFSSWTDDDLGGLMASFLPVDVGVDADDSAEAPLALMPLRIEKDGAVGELLHSQVGALAVDRSGSGALAMLVGASDIRRGTHLENQKDFELLLMEQIDWSAAPQARKVTDVSWTGNRYSHRPPTILPDVAAGVVYFTEFEDDQLQLKRIGVDGHDERVLYVFPNATRAVLSPDLKSIAYREYHRSWITPFVWIGKELSISAADGSGASFRVDAEDGDFMEFGNGGATLSWVHGTGFYEKSVAEILSGGMNRQRTELSVSFEVAVPDQVLALTDVTVLTMDGEDRVLEGATVLVEGNRITAVGTDVAIPDGAEVFVLSGHVVFPGMFDAHGHYGSPIGALNVIEQRPYGLAANLAYGVTTMYDVYGTTQKDFWLSDMLRAGMVSGPRLFSVGDPLFGTKYRTKMHRPNKSFEDALEQSRFNRVHGATALKDYSNHSRAARQQLAAACRAEGLNLVTESFNDPQMNLTQLVDGFTGLEHTMGLEDLYDDVVALFGATSVGMTPTLVVLYNGPGGDQWFHARERLWEDEKLLHWFTKEELLRYRRPTHYFDDDWTMGRMGVALRKLYEAGVSLQMGAHGQMMGLGAHWELELFVQAGFTPFEALHFATINGFRHHGLDHELGSIEVGKLADMVIVSADPREDIRNSRAIALVMKNGELFSGLDGAALGVADVATGERANAAPAKPMYFDQ